MQHQVGLGQHDPLEKKLTFNNTFDEPKCS
jgi:hypothetical protein